MGGDSSGFGRVRVIGVVAGVLGFVLAVAAPFLPVRQERVSLDWPQPQSLQLSAPLVDYVPLSLELSVPCTALRDMAGGTVLSTVPPQAPRAGSKGLVARIEERPDSGRTLVVVLRDRLLLSVPVAEIAGTTGSGATAAACVALAITSTATGTTAELTGLTRADGTPTRTTVDTDVRPQIVGVYTELDRARMGDARLHAEIDARFSSSPSGWKLAAMLGAVLCTLLALICLHRGDIRDGRRARRVLPARWWRPTGLDATVAGTLVVWHVIGANSSDDGYILTMARASREAGYTANYYRWFQVAEAPFGWPYEVLAQLTRVSEAGLWMRLPALLAGLVCWLVLSREVLPRLGSRVASSKPARWTAALVFLSLWLPYNNGLRPEPLIAVGALLTWCSMERAIATRRLLPAAVAVLIAAFSLAAGPTGLICVAALLAGARPVLRTIARRAASGSGPAFLRYAAVLAPIAAAGTLVLVVVFADQTFSTVLEATRVRQLVGPDLSWFEERTRWDSLLSVNPDGSLTRRFGVLAMLLCLFVGVLTAVRHGGRIPATARGPVARVLAVTFMALLLMMFTPTKWTHHFGVYAGLAAALAAVAAMALSRTVIRAGYVRTVFAAAVLFLLAISTTGSNGYWYVSGYGVPWPDRAPTLAGVEVSTLFLLATGLTLLIALRQYYRSDVPGGTDSALQTYAGAPGIANSAVPSAQRGRPSDTTHQAESTAADHAGTAPIGTASSAGLGTPHSGRSAVEGAATGHLDKPSGSALSAPGSGARAGDEGQGRQSKGTVSALTGAHSPTDSAPDPTPGADETSAAGTAHGAPGLAVPETSDREHRWARLPVVAPLTVAAAAMVLFEVGSLATAAISQYPAYSVGLSNLRTLTGDRCAMAEDVLVETNTADSLLTPYTGTVADGLAAENTGFTPNGVGSLAPDPGPGQSSAPPSGSGPAPGGPGGAPPTGQGGASAPMGASPSGPGTSPTGPGSTSGPSPTGPGGSAPSGPSGSGQGGGSTPVGPGGTGQGGAGTGGGSPTTPGGATPDRPGGTGQGAGSPTTSGGSTPGGPGGTGQGAGSPTAPGGPNPDQRAAPPSGQDGPGSGGGSATAPGAVPGGPSGTGPGSGPSSAGPGGSTPGGTASGPGGSAPGGTASGQGGSAPGGSASGPGSAPQGVAGVNGSTMTLPFGLVPERTPVLGSYSTGAPQRSRLTTQWYRLDLAAAQRDSAHRVLVLTVAGRIESTAPDGSLMPGQRLRVEFARRADDGTVTPLGELAPPSVGGAPGWRNLPIGLDTVPAGTTAVRLVAESGEPDPMRWLAVTPPRLPKLSPLNTVVGSTDPVLADWHVGLAFPCQRPFDHRSGVAEMPLWRIQPDKLNAQVSETWQGETGGGPLGWTGLLMQSRTIPAYLADDWTRDWGELQRLTRLIAAPPAELTVRTANTWGWSDESPIRTG
ncbi:arabinosyltransferase domain-containing protein [Nocardia neocaledoniensis]|uniref:arabinosyltransferase domain-containing protein n=1 Tax=Nocardia neocaledoniensis TaxID=236511 RepID=UPI00245419CE|nr:arabinosyltransferase domain-containing protein [Nocardia neocaledoniensis]